MKRTVRLNQQLQSISQEDKRNYRIIKLNRPTAYNAINERLLFDLSAALKMAEEDNTVRAVLLTGEGKAFCAGGDLATLEQYTQSNDGKFQLFVGRFHRVIEQVKSFPKPIIAYVNGPAIGGGFSLAMACDMRVIGEQAFLKTGYSSIALTPDGGWTELVARQVGMAKAMELYLLDERIDAATAMRLGLVNRIIKQEEWHQMDAMMDKICQRSFASFKAFKSLLGRSQNGDLQQALRLEQLHISEAAFSTDFAEGLLAFKEGRTPNFNRSVMDVSLVESA